MKKSLLIILLIILSAIPIFTQKIENTAFIGIFRDCAIHCSTYKIKTDFTFEYSAKGDVYNIARLGTWQYINRNTIHLYAPGKKQKPLNFVIKNSEGKDVEELIELPDISAINKFFIIQNNELCTLDKETEPKFCYERIKSKK